MRTRILLLLALVSGLAASAGDRDVADFLFKKAEKAYRAHRYEDAVKGYQRARAEFTPLPEAAFGLALGLEKLDREAEALAAYRTCVREVETAESPPSKWKSLARRAGYAIKRLRKRFADLDRLNRDFIDDCLAFAKKRREKSPRWARTALETVLRLDPANAEAKRLLKGVPALDPAATTKRETGPKKAWGEPLVRTDDLEGWSPGLCEPWSCSGGVVVADARRHDGHINWVDDRTFEGRFEIRVKVRVTDQRGDRLAFGVFLGDAKDYWHCFLIDSDDVFVMVEADRGNNRDIKSSILSGFNSRKWHTIRIVIDRIEASVYLDDERLFTHMADRRDTFDGKVGLFAQRCRVEFRELEAKEP
jgi:hypothetical protein